MNVVAICPNPAIDHTVVVPRLEAGETSRAAQAHTTAGGKGLNVARFAGLLGAEVTALACIGEIGAELFIDLARRDRVVLRATIAPGLPVRMCPVVAAQSGEPSTITTSDPPPRYGTATWNAFLDLVSERVVDADGVAVSGSMPSLDDGRDALVSVVEAVLRGGVNAERVWVDTSGDALRSALHGAPPVAIKINLVEALQATGRPPVPQRSSQDVAAELCEHLGSGRPPLVITAGADGAAMTVDGSVRWINAPAITTRNATASGDAFLAGLLCAGTGVLATCDDPLAAGLAAGAANAANPFPVLDPATVADLAARLTAGV